MKKPVITFLTGITGTGKSTTARILQEQCREQNLRIHFFNDYPFLIAWANEHRGQEDKVRWFTQEDGTENFDVNPHSYPEMSRWIAKRIAQVTEEILPETDIVVIESARGAGHEGKRDRYDRDLFGPIIEHFGTDVHYANIEMHVSDKTELLERVRRRLELNPTEAPPFIAEKYISPTEGVQSAHEQAHGLRIFRLNTRVDNTGKLEHTTQRLHEITRHIVNLSQRELHGPLIDAPGVSLAYRK